MLRLVVCALSFAIYVGTFFPGVSNAAAPDAAPVDAPGVIAKMLDRNAGLRTYRSHVKVRAHMLNFPFLSERLTGTTYFSAPTTFEVVFDKMPSYAKGFGRFFNDVGDPAGWSKDNDIALDGTQMLHGHPVFVLRLTKKIYSDRLKDALAFVDARTYHLDQMEWDYTNGGTIVMSQNFRDENGYEVLASQHAVVRIPYVHAVADADYGPYETNVSLDIPQQNG